MRFIPTKVHGVLDYLGALLLIAFPFLLGFDSAAARWIMIILGVGVLLYTILTDFELGLIRKIPVAGHLLMDGLGGVLLLVAPWLFGFADVDPWWPFVLMGLVELGAAMFTHTVADDKALGAPPASDGQPTTATTGTTATPTTTTTTPGDREVQV